MGDAEAIALAGRPGKMAGAAIDQSKPRATYLFCINTGTVFEYVRVDAENGKIIKSRIDNVPQTMQSDTGSAKIVPRASERRKDSEIRRPRDRQ